MTKGILSARRQGGLGQDLTWQPFSPPHKLKQANTAPASIHRLVSLTTVPLNSNSTCSRTPPSTAGIRSGERDDGKLHYQYRQCPPSFATVSADLFDPLPSGDAQAAAPVPGPNVSCPFRPSADRRPAASCPAKSGAAAARCSGGSGRPDSVIQTRHGTVGRRTDPDRCRRTGVSNSRATGATSQGHYRNEQTPPGTPGDAALLLKRSRLSDIPIGGTRETG